MTTTSNPSPGWCPTLSTTPSHRFVRDFHAYGLSIESAIVIRANSFSYTP